MLTPSLYKPQRLGKTFAMAEADEKRALHRYLRNSRRALLWKLDGLSEYDIRRPMTPTGTNLLGLVKHCAVVESGYFGEIVGRPFPGQDDLDLTSGDGELSSDMYATESESRAQVTGFYERVAAHADATIEELPLDARGHVPWWPEEHSHPTLHTLLVHMINELARHAGHADIIRESIDGGVGLRPELSNLPSAVSADEWKQYCDKLERIARSAGLPALERGPPALAGGADPLVNVLGRHGERLRERVPLQRGV
jgi:uncharacterized damage-inducible protein DinB